jgi:MbtH protein
MRLDDETSRRFCVLVNAEEQYSLWDADLTRPSGWEQVGPTGLRSECLAWIDVVWTDIRPRSARTRSDR